MMNAKTLSVVVAGVLALSVGCSDGGSNIGAHDIGDPLYSALSGGSEGTNGQNHLVPDYFIQNGHNLYGATGQTIATYDAAHGLWNLVSNTHTEALMGTYGGREVLKYALQCAMPAGEVVVYYSQSGLSGSVMGQGFLTTMTGWTSGGLTIPQAEDLMACVVAHMNPYAVVDINLSGENVNNDPNANTSGFTFDEALWQVDITFPPGGGARMETRVWPLDDLVSCGQVVDQIETRVCGTYKGGGSCDVDVRTDRATACLETNGLWKCLDPAGNWAPTIKSRLKEDQVSSLHRFCL
jgi:hypothetical protein